MDVQGGITYSARIRTISLVFYGCSQGVPWLFSVRRLIMKVIRPLGLINDFKSVGMASCVSGIWLSGAPGRPRGPAEAGFHWLSNEPTKLTIQLGAGLKKHARRKTFAWHKNKGSDVAHISSVDLTFRRPLQTEQHGLDIATKTAAIEKGREDSLLTRDSANDKPSAANPKWRGQLQ